jgi:putative ABC transport system permease protein
MNMTGALVPCSLAPISAAYLKNITAINGVKGVSDGLFLWVFDKDNFKRVLGVNWNDSLGERARGNIVAGSVPRTNTEAAVEKAYAQQYGVGINDTIGISGANFTVSGIVESSGKDIVSSNVYVGLGAAQNLAYASPNLQKTEQFEKDDINIIFVDADQSSVRAVAGKLNDLFTAPSPEQGQGTTPTGQSIGTYTISTPASFEAQISSLYALSDQVITIVSVMTLLGGSLILIKSVSHAVLERRREFGIMKAVGFRNRDIHKELLTETLLQILLGYGAGIAVSFAAIYALARSTIAITIPWELNPYPHFLLSNPESATVVQSYNLPIHFQVVAALIALVAVFAIGSVTVLLITRHINRLKAAEVLRYE